MRSCIAATPILTVPLQVPHRSSLRAPRRTARAMAHAAAARQDPGLPGMSTSAHAASHSVLTITRSRLAAGGTGGQNQNL